MTAAAVRRVSVIRFLVKSKSSPLRGRVAVLDAVRLIRRSFRLGFKGAGPFLAQGDANTLKLILTRSESLLFVSTPCSSQPGNI